MKQALLIDPLAFGKANLILELPQSRILNLAQRASPALPALPERRRAARKAVRSQREIQLAILDACRMPTVQHWIMVKARLGYDTFWKHMNELLSAGLMDETIEGSKTLYGVSAKGLELMHDSVI